MIRSVIAFLVFCLAFWLRHVQDVYSWDVVWLILLGIGWGAAVATLLWLEFIEKGKAYAGP